MDVLDPLATAEGRRLPARWTPWADGGSCSHIHLVRPPHVRPSWEVTLHLLRGGNDLRRCFTWQPWLRTLLCRLPASAATSLERLRPSVVSAVVTRPT